MAARVRAGWFVAVVASGIACGTYGSEERSVPDGGAGTPDGAAGTPDGGTGTPDGGTGPSDAADVEDSGVDTGPPALVDGATPDAMTNPTELLANSQFTSGCTSWQNNEALLSENAATFRSGPKSCRACGQGATNPWSIMQSVPAKKVVGLEYKFEAYVRTDPSFGAAMMAASARCELMAVTAAGAVIQTQEGAQIVPNTTWQRCSVSMILNAAGANAATIQAIVNGQPAGRCFLVDDASLITQP